MVCYIKRRIKDLHALRCHPLPVPHFRHFLRLTLFNLNVIPCWAVIVNGGGRCADIHRYAILLCNGSNDRGSDLISRVPVCRHTVTSYEDRIHPAIFHYGCRHVITNQRHIYPGRMQLIGGKPCSLQKRSCFIRKYMETITSFLPQINRCGCCSIFTGCKLPCIAVCKDSIPRFHKGKTVFTN